MNRLNNIKTLPASYFSITLGLLGLGLALRYAGSVNILPAIIGEGILMFATGLWVIFLLAYILKWVMQTAVAKDELHHLLQCCFISLIPITTMMVGMAKYPQMHTMGIALVAVGTVLQLLFSAYRTAGLWRGTHNFESTTPLVYVSSVAPNFISAAGCAVLGFESLGWLFFGAAMLSWLSFEPAILQRMRNATALQPELRGVLGIQLAPPFVAANTYLLLHNSTVDTITYMLVGYGILQAIFLIRLLPWIFEQGIKLNVWGFSFGLASMVSVGAHFIAEPLGQEIYWVGWVLFVFGLACMALISLRTVVWFLNWLWRG